MTARYTIFNREHAGVTPVNICEFRRNRRIFKKVIVRTDGQTNKVINTFQLSLESVKKKKSNIDHVQN